MASRRHKQASSSGGGGPPDPRLSLTLYLKRRAARRPGSAADLAALAVRVSHRELELERKKAFARPVAKVRRFAEKYGMRVTSADALRFRVQISARRSEAERAFGTRLNLVEHDGRAYHCPARPPKVPAALAGIVEAVLGLDQRPRLGRLRAMAGPAGSAGLFPSAIARLYGITAAANGAGQCIAIVEPSGGYDRGDLAAACRAMNLPVPQIADINVGKGHNAFGTDAVADKEVSLDVQVMAAVAPQARIAVYFTEATEQGFVDGVARAVHDKTNRPSVVVVTWGEPEAFWPAPARKALDAVLADAVRLGITVVAAAGDDLATERMNDGKAHVDYPASSPYVLGCGGTTITLDAAGTAIADEVVWNDGLVGTGGGISAIYPVPAFQKAANVPPSVNGRRRGRGVPDVAAAAAEINGYRIVLNGAQTVASGTSAVAPLWGAFLALVNAERGRSIGFVNTALYRQPALLKVITTGNNIDRFENIGYQAGPGWSACTGLGVPKGADLMRALTAMA